jgi:small ligand-binding sensory domain FIST
VDQSNGAIAVMDLLKVGQTVQFHLRDQTTATEDLALLLDGQQLYDPPARGCLTIPTTMPSRSARRLPA